MFIVAFDQAVGDSPKYLDAIAAIAAALIALPVGILIERYRHRQKKKEGQSAREASFLDVMANSLSDMVRDINGGKIPYRSGHQFAAMLDAFGEDTKAALGEKRWEQIDSLRQLAQDAEGVDFFIIKYGNQAVDSQVVQGWIVDAERQIGELKAESARRALS